MRGLCSGKNLLTTLVTDYIQKRRGHALLFSFKYNLLSKLLTDLYRYMDQAIVTEIKMFAPKLRHQGAFC